ncbi:LacI family DNA-binding transcriptional regulator [Liquorilactobacillus mali]|uniref:Ribose operon repressor n=1 Tax=Liquorilactobacillus mali TaxID=1618 RepID=A0A0R2FT66_9LACO|nr:LacI family DNA-binding transcriptional regulator [Liquorilactobacillus mali]KRN31657.1 ribose operon repressor [Liquorilactobacillus mali]MDN7146667.1 LacI family DNA-binding transcriptional regulator [Liquorilactobacillus mali]
MVLKMSDIAKMANVSKSAVSLAINGKDGISEETKEKILKIISEQGYKPLRKSKKDTVQGIGDVTFLVVTTSGVVQDDYRSLPFFSRLISALSVSIGRLNGTLHTVTVSADKLNEKLDDIVSNESKGVLVLGTDLTKTQVRLIKKKITNIVFLDTYYEDVVADFVTMDNYQGSKLAGKYILSKGYTNIGYFASENLMSNFSERRRGFHEILAESELKISNDHFYFISPTKLDPEGLNLKKLVTPLPKAIFCEDDYIAIRLIKAAQKEGIKVPDELAVMGFDDVYEGTLISPELTTIHVPVDQIAQQALLQLQCQLGTANWNPQKTLISTTLVERKSL